MAEHAALRFFWTFMILTALGVLINIWAGDLYPKEDAETFFKIPVTFFIFGFASFCVWAPLLAYRFLGKI